MSATEQTVSGSAPGLRRNAIGLREVLFQSITDMAPGAAIAASIPAGAALAAGSLPLARISTQEVRGNFRRTRNGWDGRPTMGRG